MISKRDLIPSIDEKEEGIAVAGSSTALTTKLELFLGRLQFNSVQ